MAVLQATIWDVAPGRIVEVIGHMAHAKKIQQRLGSTVRALQVQIAGAGSNRIAYVLRHENMTAFGNFAATLAEDPEWMMFQQTVLGSASPSATLAVHSLAVELPGLEGPFPVTGKSASVLTQIRMNPGGMEGVRAQITKVKQIAEGLGGSLSARVMQVAGEGTGIVAVAITYDDLRAYGKATDGMMASPEYAAVIAQASAKDAPGTIISRGLAVEIPI